MSIPETLNGYPVIGSLPRNRVGESNSHAVLVHRPEHPVHQYVTAVWSPIMGDSWCWGRYFMDLGEARADLIERSI